MFSTSFDLKTAVSTVVPKYRAVGFGKVLYTLFYAVLV